MSAARRMAPLFEQCGERSGATARTSLDRGFEASVLLLGEVEVGGVGVGEVREHAAISTSARVLGEGARAARPARRRRPRAAPSPCRPSRGQAPTPADTGCGRVRHRVDAFVVVDGGLHAFGDERVVAAGIAAADDQHGDPEVGDVERLASTTPRRARWRRPRSRPRRRARCRARSRSTSPWPSPATAAHVLDDRRGVGADGRRVDLARACAARARST